MDQNETEWPVENDCIPVWSVRHGQRRHIWIYDADRLVAEASDLADETVSHPYNAAQAKRVAKAARLYMKSARFYKQAGLGICAVTSYEDAATCFARLGDAEQCEECEELADSIDTHYEEGDE